MGSNIQKEVLHTPQIFRTWNSVSDIRYRFVSYPRQRFCREVRPHSWGCSIQNPLLSLSLYIYILNKSLRKHPTRHQLYGLLPPITKTIQVRRTRHVGHCWRSRDELISDVLLWTPTYALEKAGRPARTYIQQLYEDRGCSPEDLPEAMKDWEKWRERVRDIRAGGTIWWWWYMCVCVCVSVTSN